MCDQGKRYTQGGHNNLSIIIIIMPCNCGKEIESAEDVLCADVWPCSGIQMGKLTFTFLRINRETWRRRRTSNHKVTLYLLFNINLEYFMVIIISWLIILSNAGSPNLYILYICRVFCETFMRTIYLLQPKWHVALHLGQPTTESRLGCWIAELIETRVDRTVKKNKK